MSTSAELIQQAMREGNYVAVGETPPDDEVTEALPRLQNLLMGLLGTDLGEMLSEWYVPQVRVSRVPLRDPLTPSGAAAATTTPWAYPPANVRMVVKATTDATIYFPALPSDGARMAYVDVGSTGAITLNGNGRLIEGAASVADVAADPGPPEVLADPLNGRQWLYRADLANWIRLRAPGLNEQSLLPAEFDDLLVCGLAIRLAPRYGVKEIDGAIVSRFSDMESKLKKRYKQAQSMPTTDQHAPLPASIYTGI